MKNPNVLDEESSVLRLLAMLIGVGIPVGEAFELTAVAFPSWKGPLAAMCELLESGEWSELILKYNNQFSFFVPLMLRGGVESGSLDVALAEASRVIEKTATLIRVGAPENKIAEVNFLRLLGGLVGVGCPILWTLKVLDGVGLPTGVASDIYERLLQGNTLVSGLTPHPECFSQTAIRYVDMGEQTGAVPELCEEAAQIIEQQLLIASGKACLPPAPSEYVLSMLMDYDILSLFPDIPKTIARMAKNHYFMTPAFVALGKKMENIDSLSAAMKSMPDDFPAYVARMIQVGEEKQDSDEMLERIVAYLKWQHLGIESAVRLYRPCAKA